MTKGEIDCRIERLRRCLDNDQPLLLAHAKARRIAAYRIADIQAIQSRQMQLLLWTDELVRIKVVCRSGTFIWCWNDDIDRHAIGHIKTNATQEAEMEVEELVDHRLWTAWELRMFEALKRTGQYVEPSQWDIEPFRLQSIVVRAQKYNVSNEGIVQVMRTQRPQNRNLLSSQTSAPT